MRCARVCTIPSLLGLDKTIRQSVALDHSEADHYSDRPNASDGEALRSAVECPLCPHEPLTEV